MTGGGLGPGGQVLAGLSTVAAQEVFTEELVCWGDPEGIYKRCQEAVWLEPRGGATWQEP